MNALSRVIVGALAIFSCSKSPTSPEVITAGPTPPTEVGLAVVNGTTTYTIDYGNGNDSNDGSANKPFQNLSALIPLLHAGDSVVLSTSGNYGDLETGYLGVPGKSWDWLPIDTLFRDWVTIVAKVGKVPYLNKISLGCLNQADGTGLPFSVVGNGELNLIIDGVTVGDGVDIYGVRHVQIKNSQITLQGELTEKMERAGIVVANGQYITLEGNEITHANYGIQFFSTDLVIRNNHIHNNIHDGLSILGGENVLIEGNRIHDIDDGSEDEGANFYPWNMHVDGMHFRTVSGAKWPTGHKGFTIRGNLLYNIEAMGVMINANASNGKYENFIWENNIFGPTGGILFHLGAEFSDGFIFRHNTVLYAPDNVWTSPMGRKMDGQKYSFSWWPADSSYKFYNNIFVYANSTVPESYAVANNIYIGDHKGDTARGEIFTPTTPYANIEGNISDYLARNPIIGMPIPLSVAHDAGIVSEVFPAIHTDFLGKVRGSIPDIGAFED